MSITFLVLNMEVDKIRDQLARLRVSVQSTLAQANAPGTATASAGEVDARVSELPPSRTGALALAAVKALSRKTWLALDRSREAVQKENIRTDAHHLSLENLLYERSCIQREVDRCREFPTPELDRIPLEPLAAGATLDDGTAVFVAGDERQTFLNRLRHEMEARQRLERQLGERRAALASIEKARFIFESCSGNASIEKARFIEALPEHAAALRAALAPLLGHLVSAEDAAAATARGSSGNDGSFSMLPGPLQIAHARLAAAARAAAAFDASSAGGAGAAAPSAASAGAGAASAGAAAIGTSVGSGGSLRVSIETAAAGGVAAGGFTSSGATLASDAAGSASVDASAAVVHVPSSRLRMWGNLLGVTPAAAAATSSAAHGAAPAKSSGASAASAAGATDVAVGSKRRKASLAADSEESTLDAFTAPADAASAAPPPGSVAVSARDALKPHPTAVSIAVTVAPALAASGATGAATGSGSGAAAVSAGSSASVAAVNIELAARPEAGEPSRVTAVAMTAGSAVAPLVQLQLQYLPLLHCIAVSSNSGSSASASQLMCTRFCGSGAGAFAASDAGLLALAPAWLEASASSSTSAATAANASEASAAAAAVVASPPASKRARVADESGTPAGDEAGSASASAVASAGAADSRITAWAQSLAGLGSAPQPSPSAVGGSLASSSSAASGAAAAGSAPGAASAASAGDVLAALRLRAVSSACLDECVRRLTGSAFAAAAQKLGKPAPAAGTAALPVSLLASLPLSLSAEYLRAQAGALAAVLTQRGGSAGAAGAGAAASHAHHGSALARACRASTPSVKAAAALLRVMAECLPSTTGASAGTAASAPAFAPLRSAAALPGRTLSHAEFAAIFPGLAARGCLAVDCRFVRLAFALGGSAASSGGAAAASSAASAGGFAAVLFAVPAAYPLIPAGAHVVFGRTLSAAEGAALMPRPDVDSLAADDAADDAAASSATPAAVASSLCSALSAGLTAAAALLCPTPASLLFSLLHQAAALQALLSSPAGVGCALAAASSGTVAAAAGAAAPSASLSALLAGAASDAAAAVGAVEPLHHSPVGWTPDAQLRVRDSSAAASAAGVVRVAWA